MNFFSIIIFVFLRILCDRCASAVDMPNQANHRRELKLGHHRNFVRVRCRNQGLIDSSIDGGNRSSCKSSECGMDCHVFLARSRQGSTCHRLWDCAKLRIVTHTFVPGLQSVAIGMDWPGTPIPGNRAPTDCLACLLFRLAIWFGFLLWILLL